MTQKITQRQYAIRFKKCGVCGAILATPQDFKNPHRTVNEDNPAPTKGFCLLSDGKSEHWNCSCHLLEVEEA